MLSYGYELAFVRDEEMERRDDMSTNMDVLRGKMVERRITQEEMAKQIGVDPSTFSRKMKSGGVTFTVGQMHKIVEVLKLTGDEAATIFLW